MLGSLNILSFMYHSSHTIVSWYFGPFSCVIFFPFFFCLAHLALQNVNKDYIIFSYFCNFVAKSDQKLKKKNGMNKTNIYISVSCNSARLEHDFTKHHRGQGKVGILVGDRIQGRSSFLALISLSFYYMGDCLL